MRAGRVQTKSVQILTAVFRPPDGPAGIGVMVANAQGTVPSSLREQAVGSPEYLHLRAVLRALQLGRKLRAGNVSILCPDEYAVKLITRESPVEEGSRLVPLYMRIRALMHTFRLVEILAVSRSRVEPARRLAIAASRGPAPRQDLQRSLFAAR